MSIVPAGVVKVGDKIRYGSDPFFREINDAVRHGDGTVDIEVRVGGLLEKLPPMPYHKRIEVDRG